MIRIRQIEVDINQNDSKTLTKKIASKLKIRSEEIKTIQIKKKSIDARRKNQLKFIYEVDVEVKNEKNYIGQKDIFPTPDETYHFEVTGTKQLKNRPIIVGSGPAGLFAAYFLSKYGYNPLIIERGEKVEDRIKTVEEFWKSGKLNPNSNVQFGEGGAGTFSDGKLNTLTKDPAHRMKKIFEIFVECGADKDILYDYKPHIGTDILRKVVQNIRTKIIEMGGEFKYQSCLTDVVINNNKLEAIQINQKEIIPTDILILAIGHSARDTIKMLFDRGLNITSKPFAVGIRIEHPQKMINQSQYGIEYHKQLPPASYKLTYTSKNGRGVYSFCMCPGGYVVNASSEEGYLAINGMSNQKRESENANSAIVVTITSDDFGPHPLDGIRFQKNLEQKAYQIGKGKIPIQLYGDFKKNQNSSSFHEVKPNIKGNYQFANLNDLLSQNMKNSLMEGIDYFGSKIKGFDREDAIITGIESRTSSPVRILRDDKFLSNIEGIYPCGEGSGYAGGITTSAMDGIKVAESVMQIYKNKS